MKVQMKQRDLINIKRNLDDQAEKERQRIAATSTVTPVDTAKLSSLPSFKVSPIVRGDENIVVSQLTFLEFEQYYAKVTPRMLLNKTCEKMVAGSCRDNSIITSWIAYIDKCTNWAVEEILAGRAARRAIVSISEVSLIKCIFESIQRSGL